MASSKDDGPSAVTTQVLAEVPRKKKMVKRKPARKQVEVGQVVKKAPEQTGSSFNVWYGKWAGGDKYDSYNVKEKSQTRVNMALDSGYTRGDGGSNAYCCLFFARGCCPYGSECTYLHRMPPKASDLPDASLDVFGREKHSDYRDDMGGVGSFTRQNRTLYIGRLKETRNTAEMVEQHFEEFGEIERIRILQSRGVAFVTYYNELNAQFAKEAMMCQSLDSDEVLNVRWATEDPNPTAKVREHKELVQQGEDGISRALDPDFVQSVREMDELEGIVEPRKFEDADFEGDVRGAKKARTIANADAANDNTSIPKAARLLEIERPPSPPSQPMGILSATAVDSLKLISKLQANGSTTAKLTPINASTPPVSGLGNLADYGSDSD